MNRKSSPLIRSISASLAAVFLFTQVLFAHNVQKSVWEERRLAARLPSVSSPALPGFDTNHIPAASILDRFVPAHQRPQIGNSILPSLVPLLSAHGVIKDIRLAKPDRARKGLEPPVLVYIQDVHGQTEAQSHMASMILKLLEIQPKALVGLEGAAGKIDVEKFRRASSEINKEIGEFFLETDLIGGPEMAAFAAKEAPRLWGVEDRDLYLKNVEAVRQALPKKKEWLTTVEKLKIDVREKKRSIYSPALKNLDEKAEAKESGDLSLGDYLAYLVGTAIPAKAGSQAVNTGLAPRFRGDDDFGYPTLSLFLKTWAIEKSLDFSAAEREREIFLSRLVQVMGKEELKRLVETSVAFKSGVVSYPDYYRGLRDAAQRAGLEISNYPHFETFIRYTLQADAINAEAFLKEMGRYEEAVWRSLCRTKEQEELVQTSAGVGLLEKLVRLNLTTDEWKKVLTERESIHRLVPANEVSRLRPFEKFYEVAEARNEAMVNNLLKRHPRASRHPRESGDPGCKPSVLDSRLRGNDVGSRLSILVAGGFHGAGLKDLIPKDFTLVTVAPKLVDVDSKEGAEYLSVFTRERTPLEKLFESPRISLSRTLSLAPLERTEASIAVGVLSNSLPALWPELRRNGSAHARFGRLGVWVRDLGGRAVKKAFPFGTLVFSRASGQREVSLYDLQAPWGTAGSRILSPVYRLKKAFTEHFAFVPAVLVPTLTATIPIVLKLFVPNLPLNMPLLLIMSAAAGIVAIAISLDDIVRRHGLTHSRPGLRQLYFTIPLLELSALVSALAAFGLMSPLLSLVSLPWAIVLIVVTMLNAGVLAYLVGHSLINGLSVFIPSLAPLAGINWLSDKTETLKMDVSSYAEHGNGLALFPLAVLMQRFAQLDGPTKEFMVEKLLRLMEFSTLAVIIRESMISRSVKVIGDITMEELALAFDALKAGDWTKCAEMQGRLTPSPESIETKNFLSALAYIMERGFPFPSGPARAGVGKEKEAPLEPAPPAASSPQERFARSLRENSLTDLTEWKKAYEHYVEIGDLEGAEYFLGLICRANYSLFEPAEAAVFGPLLNLYNDHTSARDQREKSDVKKFNQLKDTFRKCLSDIDLFRMTEARNLTIP
ncbi:MAG: hypothetical protein LHV69_08305 [Elusimicrobia bacterium]|nr:hypothetical protein [Candidatus Obscuribacterium magneticum]